jgi:hypothetical protein
VPVLILAAVTPSDTPHGYNWTFAFPMLLFIVIAAILYYLFGRPHRRVPPRPVSAVAGRHLPDPATAGAASVAGGLTAAAGGGTTGSLEPQGAQLAASAGETPGEPGSAASGGPAAGDDGTASDGGAHE